MKADRKKTKNKAAKKENKNKFIRFSKFSRFLIITAHPDDETIFSGGLLSRFSRSSFVFCSTHGLGVAKNSKERKEVKKKREKEFKNALKKLNVKFKIANNIDDLNYHLWLEKYGAEKTFNKIKELLKPMIKNLALNFKPNFIVTHNSLGEYGHFLHKTIYRIVYETFRELREEFREFSGLKLLTFAPELRIRNINTNRLLKTKHQKVHLRLILSDTELDKKLMALKCYSSQKSIFDTNNEDDFRVENYHIVMK
ncbi:MAG: PIG-L deacetylase family protein [Candidatus Woesearchaeota archaeon]